MVKKKKKDYIIKYIYIYEYIPISTNLVLFNNA